MNNLKELVLGMHMAQQLTKAFPAPAIYDKAGKPLLSWRVKILPYIEQQRLYDRFHLDEAWDSPHNKTLLSEMPNVFVDPSAPELKATGKTVYLLPTGKRTMFADKEPPKIQSITDGLSNTIMIVGVRPDHAVEWTKPDDLEVNFKDPWAGLKDALPEGFLAAFADGSIHFISNNLDTEMLKLLLDPKDGKALPQQDF